jgi:hypothetical protein
MPSLGFFLSARYAHRAQEEPVAKFFDKSDPRENRPRKRGVLAAVFGELTDFVRFCWSLGAKVIVGLLFLGQSSLA